MNHSGGLYGQKLVDPVLVRISIITVRHDKRGNMKYFAFVFSGLMVLCFVVQPTFSEEPRESLYSQLNRSVIRLEHFESISQEGSSQVITKNISDGTAFFVASKDQLFVVSARHVVDRPHDLHARVQTKNARTGEEKVFLLKLSKDKWIYHTNKGDAETQYVDVAVMRILSLKDWGIVHFLYEPNESPDKKKNQLPAKDAEPPKPILVFGFPADVGFELANQHPLGRLGIVSMKAGKRFLKVGRKYAEERACLIDVRIFPGNSGSPVMNEMRVFDSEPRLLGLVTATNSSLDFAVMEPVSRIRETLDQAINSEAQGSWEEIRQ